MNALTDEQLDELIDCHAHKVRLQQATEDEKKALLALRELRRWRKEGGWRVGMSIYDMREGS